MPEIAGRTTGSGRPPAKPSPYIPPEKSPAVAAITARFHGPLMESSHIHCPIVAEAISQATSRIVVERPPHPSARMTSPYPCHPLQFTRSVVDYPYNLPLPYPRWKKPSFRRNQIRFGRFERCHEHALRERPHHSIRGVGPTADHSGLHDASPDPRHPGKHQLPPPGARSSLRRSTPHRPPSRARSPASKPMPFSRRASPHLLPFH